MTYTPPTPKEDRPLGSLLGDLMGDVTELVRKEIQLAKAELSEKTSQAIAGVTSLAIGGLIAFAGLLVLLDAAVYGLAELLGNVPLWASALVVGVVVLGAGMVLLLKGRANLSAENLAPRRTVEAMRQNAETIKEQVQ
jgi:hypothetical protein